jgi:hypothetical protein
MESEVNPGGRCRAKAHASAVRPQAERQLADVVGLAGKAAALFALDSFGGGFVPQTFIA